MSGRGELLVPIDRATVTYLSLGANLGDREDILWQALHALDEADGIKLTAVSPIYETAPWGKTDQPAFLNLCAQLETMLEPKELLAVCQGIEQKLGRVRHEHWGARIIDIDIVAMDGISTESDTLSIPHPYAVKRAFVLVPLFDIAPDLVVERRPVWEWLKEVEGRDGVKRI